MVDDVMSVLGCLLAALILGLAACALSALPARQAELQHPVVLQLMK